ncbi:MAG: glycosyltransferase 87 family protein, partial [Candidatus Paceibacterales bacterium]
YWIFIRKKMRGAILIGLAVHIKLLPLVFIPYLFYRNKVKEGLLCIATVAVLFFLPAIFFGMDFNNSLITGFWTSVNPLNAEFNQDQNGAGFSMQNLQAFYCTYFTNFNTSKEVIVNIATLTATQLAWLVNITRLLFAGLTLYFLRTFPFTEEKNRIKIFWEIAYLSYTIPLIFPNQQRYSFALLTPVFCYITAALIFAKHRSALRYKIALVSSVVSFVLIISTSIGMPWSTFGLYLKLVTWGTLAGILPLMLLTPDIWNSPEP